MSYYFLLSIKHPGQLTTLGKDLPVDQNRQHVHTFPHEETNPGRNIPSAHWTFCQSLQTTGQVQLNNVFVKNFVPWPGSYRGHRVKVTRMRSIEST